MRVHYFDSGSGDEALVLVHGWACDHTVWSLQLEGALPQRARVLAVDLPGHGRSDAPEIEYSMDLFADAIAAVMDDAGVERAVLVGHSNGTPTVRQFYRRHGDRTLAVVAVDGALKSFFEEDDPALAAWREQVLSPDYKELTAGFIDGLTYGMSEELVASVKEAMLATPQHVMLGDLEAGVDPAIWGDDPIDVPVLCVMAESPFWSAEYEAYVRDLCPRLDYVVLSGVSHFLMMHEPEEFETALLTFLDERDLLR